jgi:hypothetical protein
MNAPANVAAAGEADSLTVLALQIEGLSPAARRAELRRFIVAREYADLAARFEREFNCFVLPSYAETRFSRRMEAELPALVEALEARLARRAA